MCVRVNAHKHICAHAQTPLVEQEEKEGQRGVCTGRAGGGVMSAARDRKPTIRVLSGSAYIFLL